MTNSLNDAVQLNNEAIELLARSAEESDMQEGIDLFTKSLRTLKTMLVNQGTEEQNDACSSEQDSSSPTEAMGCNFAAIIDSPCAGLQPDEPSSPESNFVYKRMFRLFPNTSQSEPSAIQIYISCVIFNIALLHQHQASLLQLGNVRASLLEKAALLYKSCFQIVLNVAPSPKRSSSSSSSNKQIPFDDVSFLLKVGALNNSAQILYECDEFEQACDRLEMVENILCSQGLAETQCCFTVQEFEGILSNVLLLKPPTVAVAA